MSHEVLNRIRARLAEAGVSYREIEHAPTRTSEESARARGEPLSAGAKALLLRVGDTFRLFVLPAHRKLDSAAVKRYFGTKSLRFATSEELLALTGLGKWEIGVTGKWEIGVTSILSYNESPAHQIFPMDIRGTGAGRRFLD